MHNTQHATHTHTHREREREREKREKREREIKISMLVSLKPSIRELGEASFLLCSVCQDDIVLLKVKPTKTKHTRVGDSRSDHIWCAVHVHVCMNDHIYMFSTCIHCSYVYTHVFFCSFYTVYNKKINMHIFQAGDVWWSAHIRAHILAHTYNP